MLIASQTRVRRKSCCGSCRSGGACCSSKPKPVPAFKKQRGLWLPRRDLTLPKNLLQYPSEAEWSGLWRPWLPLLMPQVIDMSCLPCCQQGCCGETGTKTGTFSDETGTCACLPATVTLTAGTPDVFTGTAATGCGPPISFEISCGDGVYAASATCGVVDQGELVSQQCDPFKLVFDWTVAGGFCCSGGFRLTIE